MDPASATYLEKIGHKGLAEALDLHRKQTEQAAALKRIQEHTDNYMKSLPKAADELHAEGGAGVCKCPEGPLLAPKPNTASAPLRTREPMKVKTACSPDQCTCEEGPLLEEHVTRPDQIAPLLKQAKARAELHAAHLDRLETLHAKLNGIDEKTYRALADIPGLEIQTGALSLEETEPPSQT